METIISTLHDLANNHLGLTLLIIIIIMVYLLYKFMLKPIMENLKKRNYRRRLR